MKILCALLAGLLVVGCNSNKIENPDADAQTYSEDSANDEVNAVLEGRSMLKTTLSVKVGYTFEEGRVQRRYYIEQSSRKLDLKTAQEYRHLIQSEIARIDDVTAKYTRSFRTRAKDGDLKLQKLTPEVLTAITQIRSAWQETLTKLESEYKLD